MLELIQKAKETGENTRVTRKKEERKKTEKNYDSPVNEIGKITFTSRLRNCLLDRVQPIQRIN